MRSRLARWFVRTAIVLAAVVDVFAASGWAVLSLPQFGAPMSGARLERAKANPQYRDGRFVNLQPEAPTRLAALGGIELVTPRLGERVDADREFRSTAWWEAVR